MYENFCYVCDKYCFETCPKTGYPICKLCLKKLKRYNTYSYILRIYV